MFTHLIANGDSFTAGDEMPDHSRDNRIRSNHTWAPVLTRALNIPVLGNIAWGANSPQAIARTTIESLHDLVTSLGVQPQGVLVGVMWGIVNRFEYVHQDRPGEWVPIYPTLAARGDAKATQWYKNFFSDYYGAYNYLESIRSLQSFLREHGFPFFMTTVCSPFDPSGKEDGYCDNPRLNYLRDLIDWESFYFVPHPSNAACGFRTWGVDNGYPTYPGHHLKEAAHADYVRMHLAPWVAKRFGFSLASEWIQQDRISS